MNLYAGFCEKTLCGYRYADRKPDLSLDREDRCGGIPLTCGNDAIFHNLAGFHHNCGNLCHFHNLAGFHDNYLFGLDLDLRSDFFLAIQEKR